MKKLIIYISVLVFGFVTINDANAQRRRNDHRSKTRKEYAKYHKKQDRTFYKYSKNEGKAYRKYYKEREIAYKKYIKRQGVRYRDHDAWYYNKRFHQHNDYVYFPKYHTYYDPYRRGYVYPRNNGWVFAASVPSFMVGVDLGGLSLQFISKLPI